MQDSTTHVVFHSRKVISLSQLCIVSCWRGYLSGVRCNLFAHGPADATVTPLSLASLKSKLV